jgi:halocyanin-like protein
VRETEPVTRRRLVAGVAVAGLSAGCLESTDEGPYDGYLANANGFDGVVDRTDADSVTIAVGAGEGLAFGPAAIRVSSGTTVVWEWTGRGNRHNVVSEDDRLSSDYYVQEGNTYQETLSESGVIRYYCSPHRSGGMLGVVEVV